MTKLRDRFTSALFIKFVRTKQCCRCQKLGVVQSTRTTASHMVSKKRGDGSDALAVPACLSCHPQSTKSARELLIDSGVNLDALHSRLWYEFLAEHGIVMQGPDGVHKDITQNEFETLMLAAGLAKLQGKRR